MATTIRSFNKPFELVDYTSELLLVPNTWGLIRELGFFSTESVSQHTVTVEANQGTLALVTDQVRGARNTMNSDDGRKILSFAVPHFPLDDAIMPQDVQGKRAYGSADGVETKDAVLARKLERIRKSHAATLEAARAHAITTGTVYSPNGTVAGNFYTDFGVTQKSIDFVLGTTTTDILAKSEEAIAHIQDNIMSGESVSSIVAIASPEFFAKLIAHAKVTEAYKYYSSTQEPLRDRLGSGVYRTFTHGGVTYIEYRGSYNGSRLIPAGEAYFLPRGTADMFVTYFSPANKFSHVNTMGEEAYAFVYEGQTDEQITVQTESNFLNLIRRPQAVVKATTSN